MKNVLSVRYYAFEGEFVSEGSVGSLSTFPHTAEWDKLLLIWLAIDLNYMKNILYTQNCIC